MRNIFIALAFVLIGTFSFSNNSHDTFDENLQESGVCVYTITRTYTDIEGNVTTTTTTHTVPADSYTHCQQIAQAHVKFLNAFYNS
ncbi:MAG: hypothetical protein RQ756_10100 [Flavobacteriaceae bacterium]|nr:hypothetical protein [Flavobacteriaceae bacterium]